MQDHDQLFCATERPKRNRSPKASPRRGVTPGPSRQRLARDIEAFLDRSGMYPTPFGIKAAKDDKLLWRIKHAPKGISLDKADRIYAFMTEWTEANSDADHPGDRKQETRAK